MLKQELNQKKFCNTANIKKLLTKQNTLAKSCDENYDREKEIERSQQKI